MATIPLLISSSTPSCSSSTASTSSFRSSASSEDISDDIENPPKPPPFELLDAKLPIQSIPFSQSFSYKPLAVLSGHVGSISCLALCGEFLLSASQGNDIIVWQQPDLRPFTKFGHGEGSVKALVTMGSRVFTAHQDSRVRVWKVSRRSENVFRLVDTLPTKKDYLGKFMNKSNYVQTRRHHKKLWIEHADSISCLAISNGLVYSGSWDKTLKVWRISDFKCLESIKAHDDAVNAVAASKGVVYSASADGKIKAWGRENQAKIGSHVLKGILEGHKDVSVNSVVVSEDSRWVYGGGSDGFVMGWEGVRDCSSWKLVCETKAHQMAVLSMCLVGEFLCSGSADKSIGIWKRQAFGKLCKVGAICGHEGPVKCLQGSPNNVGGGFLLYSGSLDKSLRVWWVSKHSSNGEDEEDHVTTRTSCQYGKSIVLN
ncbi:putative WD repeat-containing protein [Morus notabilis]|uniref:Putative WD repeat-containing protein n=2 Tax=Morus notabilis TaxID=981085 RepID=W9RU89_9ROSA|nr:putative WD repeat-containing protein [Morus notabilis]